MSTAPNRLSLMLLAAAVLLAGSADTFWSLSVDLAHHYALVVRLTETWLLQVATDPSLGEMNTYPRLAHQFAAVLARLVGSPLLGLHLTALLAIFVCLASLAAMLLSLPRHAAIGSALTLAGAALGGTQPELLANVLLFVLVATVVLAAYQFMVRSDAR